jgi:arylsulfatase A-like enzyme
MRLSVHAPLIGTVLLALASCAPSPPAEQSAADRPNILLIIADDLGYADLGSYGGDISTPNIDALAARGVRFTQFHTAPMCAPTRAMLLSGNDNHVAGMGMQGGAPPPLNTQPGYEGHLSDRVVPFPKLLREAGYQTYSVGKWHLGTRPEHTPTAAGFDRSFQLLQGAGDHFSDIALSGDDSVSTYWDDGAYGSWPPNGYSTEVYTDRLLGFIRDGLPNARPFFAWVAYTSPHWPLQVPDDYLDRYRGRYDMGYDRLRELRFESLQGAGIVPADRTLPPRRPDITPWERLSADEQRIEARKMELYAAMLENLDDHVGRLLGALADEGVLDNTLVVFMSDNGAAAEDFYRSGSYAEWLQRNYDNRYENMGRPTSYVSYGAPWAEAGSAPYRGHKGWAHEGGIVAPMIVAGPGIAAAGSIQRAYAGVSDLAPTLLEVAGAEYPGPFATATTRPMSGSSLLSLLRGEVDRVHDPSELFALSHSAQAYVRMDPWKLVSEDQFAGLETFALYDLSRDPGETTDLSDRFPAIRAELLDSLAAFRRRVGVVIPESR